MLHSRRVWRQADLRWSMAAPTVNGMRLKPLDIRQPKFRRSLRGYDSPQVDAFLENLAQDFEALQRETHRLRDDLLRQEAELNSFREREQTLKETMLSATRITEDIKENARKDAEVVIAQAEMQAQRIVQNAHGRLTRIMDDIDELRRQRVQFEASLRSTIDAHRKLIDALNEREVPGPSEGLGARNSPSSDVSESEPILLEGPKGESRLASILDAEASLQ